MAGREGAAVRRCATHTTHTTSFTVVFALPWMRTDNAFAGCAAGLMGVEWNEVTVQGPRQLRIREASEILQSYGLLADVGCSEAPWRGDSPSARPVLTHCAKPALGTAASLLGTN